MPTPSRLPSAFLAICAGLLAAGLSTVPARAAERVDVALILAVDISLSMDRDEQRDQREGYIEAITHPAVLDAIRRGLRGRIAVSYVEWGGPWKQRPIVPWTIIASAADAAAFADALAAAPIDTSRGTSISAALDYATGYFDEAPSAERLVIDISGDGPNNMGDRVLEARERALSRGVEVNGLPLMLKEPDPLFSIPELDIYYQDCVVGGPSAFVIPVLDRRRFASAIRQKLVLEIAGAPPQGIEGVSTPTRNASRQPMDCTIGEKLYERWRRSLSWN